MSHPREEIEKALRRTLELQEGDDWDGFSDAFSEDAVYVEHHEGTFRGREVIREWLVPVMARCQGWTFPVDWISIDGDRAIYRWRNRLPGLRADGSHYEFAGLTVKVYAGEGLFSFQEDVYNWEEVVPVLRDWARDHRGGS